jgi:hypothetical protein
MAGHPFSNTNSSPASALSDTTSTPGSHDWKSGIDLTTNFAGMSDAFDDATSHFWDWMSGRGPAAASMFIEPALGPTGGAAADPLLSDNHTNARTAGPTPQDWSIEKGSPGDVGQPTSWMSPAAAAKIGMSQTWDSGGMLPAASTEAAFLKLVQSMATYSVGAAATSTPFKQGSAESDLHAALAANWH